MSAPFHVIYTDPVTGDERSSAGPFDDLRHALKYSYKHAHHSLLEIYDNNGEWCADVWPSAAARRT